MSTSHCTHKEPCPKCRSMGADTAGDNLAVFDDGHKWCFSCGLWVPAEGQTLDELGRRIQQKQEESSPNDLALPSDYTPAVPTVGLNWLAQYGITNKEIISNRIGWSQSYEALVYPVFNPDGGLIYYQTRTISPVAGGKRVKTYGSSEQVFLRLGGGERPAFSLVLVEDLISAIKVSRHMDCMPLWGSNISQERLNILSKSIDHLYIWLDHDKARYSIAKRIKASVLFETARSIITPNDPKECLDSSIRKYLNL